MKRLLLLIAASLLLPLTAYATQITVPSASGAGYGLISGSAGSYFASSTCPLAAGTNVTFTGGTPYTFGPCVTISATGGGSSFGYPFPSSATTTVLTLSNGASIPSLTNLTNNGFVKTSGGNGTLSIDTSTYLTANQSITLSGDISGSGATSITTAIGANKVTVGMLAQAAANTVLGNPTGSTGNIQAFATSSLGIALSDTTGTLTVGRGGTGQTSFTGGNLLYGSGSGALQNVATTSVSLGTGLNGTGTLGALVGGSTATIKIADTAVTPGSYTNSNITVDQQGRITSASNGASGSGGAIGTSTQLVNGNVDFSTGVNTIGNDSAFFWDATNHRLGIGTTSPEKLLMVEGNQSGGIARIQRDFTTAAGNLVGTYDVTLNETTGTADLAGPAQTFSIRNNGGATNILGDIAAFRNSADNTGNLLLRAYGAGVAGTQSLVIDGLHGDVAIGTTSPSNSSTQCGNFTFCNVYAGAGLNEAQIKNIASTSLGQVRTFFNARDVDGTLVHERGEIGTETNHDFSLFSNNSARLTVTKIGGVNIGPTYWDGNLFPNTSGGLLVEGNTGLGTTSPGSLLSIGGTGTGWNFYDNATSTKSGVGGINILQGCFAVNGTCISASGGGVSSVTGTYPVISSGGSTPAISLAFGTSTSNTWGGIQTITSASTTNITASNELVIPNGSTKGSSIAGQLELDTTDNQLKAGDGTNIAVFDQRRFYSFGYATSTAWTGSTTPLVLAPFPVAGTIKSIMCTTDIGTLNADLYYGPTPTHLAMIAGASTTPGILAFSSNNTQGATASSTVVIGTPSGSPTNISCTATVLITGT